MKFEKLKYLSCIALSLTLLNSFPDRVLAAETVDVSDASAIIDKMKQKPKGQPTLDYINLSNNAKSAYKVVETNAQDNYLFAIDNKYYKIELKDKTITPALGDKSAYTITSGTEADYTFKIGENYYKVNVKDSIVNTLDRKVVDLGATSDPIKGNFVGKTENITGTFDYHDGGAAIKNNGEISLIEGNFVENSVTGAYSSGGAIFNKGVIETITGDFISNSANSSGGAIYNYKNANIGSISGDFISNSSNSSGGAIYNYENANIGSISGDFISNSANGGGGGAIYNDGTIETITGDFISNSANSSGGAIYNDGTITNLTGDFISNSANSGGAVYNDGTIETITGDFISNSSNSDGGAVYNDGIITNLTGDFISNSSNSNGGAIFNYRSTIETITGDFISNSANGNGGAIYNHDGKITNLTGDFISNSANGGGGGGAIYNSNGTITSLTGDFISNSANGGGGAIYNGGTIETFMGDFISNSSNGNGGAIYNANSNSKIETITGDFISNSANGGNGGAIYNGGTITSLTGDLISNSANGGGGAVYNGGIIETFTGDLISNSANGGGGAVYNSYNAKITNLTGDFISNSSNGSGGAIYNSGGEITKITGNFKGNLTGVNGGAINNSEGNLGGGFYFEGIIDTIEGNFTGNSTGANGGAIYNDYECVIKNLTGDFIGNFAGVNGGAIANRHNIGSFRDGYYLYYLYVETIVKNDGTKVTLYRPDVDIDAFKQSVLDGQKYDIREYETTENNVIENTNYTSIDDYINARLQYGYTLENLVDYYNKSYKNDLADIEGIVNSSFINNYVKSTDESTVAKGGAIYNSGKMNLIADNATSVIKGNYTLNNGVKDDNAIYMDNDDYREPELNFITRNEGKIYLYDNIRGAKDGYDINITGDGTGTFGLYNNIYGANLGLGNVKLDAIDNKALTQTLNKLTLTGNTDMYVDVDLANLQMDRFSAKSYGNHNGLLTIKGMNLLSDTEDSKAEILFAQSGLKDNVESSINSLPDQKSQTAYTPIYKYDVKYDNKDDGGYFVFDRGSKLSSSNNSSQFNPAILATPVSSSAVSQSILNEAFQYSFQHADTFTQFPLQYRLSKINEDKYKNTYALLDNSSSDEPSSLHGSTDYNYNLGSLHPDHGQSGWMRPYTTFESISLKNGPKIDSINYGSIFGYDGDFKHHRRGWSSIGTMYLGYNGASTKYANTNSVTNGGLLGFTKTFYKNNFWFATTLTAGANATRNSTMYGSDNFATLMAGIGAKTGYNFEFKEGRYIIQPMVFLNYTFINPFDYTNAANVRIDSSPSHNIQINPNLRFIANLKNGWQPYLGAGVVLSPYHDSKTLANNILLPEMSIKPYVEYHFGLQRNWADKYSAFFQTMIRNGGRNGVALTAGFSWAIGECEHRHSEEL